MTKYSTEINADRYALALFLNCLLWAEGFLQPLIFGLVFDPSHSFFWLLRRIATLIILIVLFNNRDAIGFGFAAIYSALGCIEGIGLLAILIYRLVFVSGALPISDLQLMVLGSSYVLVVATAAAAFYLSLELFRKLRSRF